MWLAIYLVVFSILLVILFVRNPDEDFGLIALAAIWPIALPFFLIVLLSYWIAVAMRWIWESFFERAHR
jgi:hypothetical protein